VLIRLELSAPGIQYIADNQLYNSIITAHAILMIFFMVNKFYMLNIKTQSLLNMEKVNEDEKNLILIGNKNNNDKNEKDKNLKSKEKYTKILVENPFKNRDIILKVTKKQKGVYV
jgi:hypothetical protein